MQHVATTDRLWGLLESVVRDEGLELYDAERSGGRMLRVFVALPKTVGLSSTTADSIQVLHDGVTGNGAGRTEAFEGAGMLGDLDLSGSGAPKRGVSSDDCSRICRRLMVLFEAEGAQWGFSAEPEIEVSSSGLERELRLLRHYRGAVGETVQIVCDRATAKMLAPTGVATNGAGDGQAGSKKGADVATLRGVIERVNEAGDELELREAPSGTRWAIGIDGVRRAKTELVF